MDVSLVMFKADGTRRDFPVLKERVVIGRKNDCDLRIPLSSVSRQHCEIRITGSQVKIRDLGSSNGTYHNNIRIQEAMLMAGDEISIGPVVFTVVVDGHPEQIEPVRTIVAHDEGGSSAAVHRTEDPLREPAPRDEADRLPMPDETEAAHTSSLDLDDPIAALERLAAEEDDADELQFLSDDDDRLT